MKKLIKKLNGVIKMKKEYYILAIDRTKYSDYLVWWKPNNHGYTNDLNEAGLYSEFDLEHNTRYYNNNETHPVETKTYDNLDNISIIEKNDDNLSKIGAFEKYNRFEDK